MTAQIIPFETKNKDAVCSFCKKPKAKVKKMAGNNNAFICDACLAICTKLVKEPTE